MPDPGGRGLTVEARGLRKTYGGRAVVDQISFRLEPGSVTGLVGPNGSGKTTTLGLMVGLVRGEGETLFGGRPMVELGTPQRSVGVMLDGRFGHPKTTVRKYLRCVAALKQVPDAAVMPMLDRVGLEESALERLDTLSLGMAQRLNLASALLGDPQVLVVDEPTNALDPAGVLLVRRMIRECAERGGTVLFSSHLLSEVETISDRLMVLVDGVVVADAAATEFQHVYGEHRVVVRVADEVGAVAAFRASGIVWEGLDGAFAVRGISRDALGLMLHDSGVPVLELRDERQSLEQLFFEIVAREVAA